MKFIRLIVLFCLVFVNSVSFASYDAVFNKDCFVFDKPKSVLKGKPQSKGNSCTVLEEKDDWCKIVYDSDKIGWVKILDISVSNSNIVSNILDNLDGYKLKTKLTVTSKMKQKKDQYVKYFTLNCNGYNLKINTTYADDIFQISKEYSFQSMKEAKIKMQQEAEKIESKYGLPIYSEERTKKGGFVKSYNVSSFDYIASVKAEYDDFNEKYICSVNVLSTSMLYEAPRIAIEYNNKK